MSSFRPSWTARVLTAPPLIAPARQFMYPQHVPGEEDAMNRGALLIDVKPANMPNFLATCALGFRDPVLPTSIHTCPRPEDLLAIAGGYAYLIDTQAPERSLFVPLRPVTQILAAADLILLAGFHRVAAIGAEGLRWESDRLSWEGVTMTEVVGNGVRGTGWDMRTDRDVPFLIDLSTGKHSGGAF